MNDFNPINKMRFWSQKILPLTYDNSLSYYEVLCKVVNYLNKVIEDVNQIPDFIQLYVDEQLTDERIITLLYTFIRNVEDGITPYNEGENVTSSADYNINSIIWWNDKLYIVIRNIETGSAFVDSGSNPNIELIDFSTLFNNFASNLKSFISDVDDGTSSTALGDRYIGELVWINDKLYRVTKAMTEGNAYVYTGVNQNVEKVTLNDLFSMLEKGFTPYNEGSNTTAQRNYNEMDLIWWNDWLYMAKVDISAGDSLVVDTNIETFSINKVVNHFNNVIGDLDDLKTSDKDSLVEALNEIFDNIEDYGVVNVINYGAVGDGVADDSSAIADAVSTGKIVYFPVGTYKVTTLSNIDKTKIIGFGSLVINSHTYPIKDENEVSIYETDFASLSAMKSWINHSKYEKINIYFNSSNIEFTTQDYLDYLKEGIIHIYPQNNIQHAIVDVGEVYIHNPNWYQTSEVSHLVVTNEAICHIVGTETVYSKAEHFHYWVMNATLYLNNVTVNVNANCIFEFYLYAERNSYVEAGNFTWAGSTGTCWGCACIENSFIEANVTSQAEYNVFFPSSFSTSPNVNSRDYILSTMAVGGKVGNIPDYGWKPYASADIDLAGLNGYDFNDIGDYWNTLTIYGYGVKTAGDFYCNIRRMFENNYDMTAGDYMGYDEVFDGTNFTKYSMDSNISMWNIGTGSGGVDFQITFIQYAGLTRPAYVGYVKDMAGQIHYLNGFCTRGRVSSIRLYAPSGITEGWVNMIQNL